MESEHFAQPAEAWVPECVFFSWTVALFCKRAGVAPPGRRPSDPLTLRFFESVGGLRRRERVHNEWGHEWGVRRPAPGQSCSPAHLLV